MKPNRGSRRVPPGRGGYDSEIIEVTGGPDYHMPVPAAKYRGPLIPMGTGEGVPEGVPQRAGPGAFLRNRTSLIPTAAETRQLPRFAQTAFAARCARRVFPAFRFFWPEAPQKDADVVQMAVQASESYGTKAEIIEALGPALEARDVGNRACLGNAHAANTAFVAGYAATAADATTHGSIAARAAVENAAHILFVTATIDSPLTAQLRCIRRDFVRLKRLAQKEKWTDDTPVPPSVFGPMWPEGVAPYWAVESPPPLPT